MSQKSLAPLIETERLRLRGHRLDDFPGCLAMWADPIVTRHIGGKPSTEQQTWSRLLNYVGHWSLMGFGFWALEEKVSGTFIGELGFADFKRDISPPIQNTPELGWALIPEAHGKGYATEALRSVVAWGDVHFKSGPTVCIINPENLASIRVAEKVGYRELLRTTYSGHPTILFGRNHL